MREGTHVRAKVPHHQFHEDSVPGGTMPRMTRHPAGEVYVLEVEDEKSPTYWWSTNAQGERVMVAAGQTECFCRE